MIRRCIFCILLFTWTLANGQFLYNYDAEDQRNSDDSEDYDSSAYRYNSPSSLQQYFPDSLRSPPAPPEPKEIIPERKRTRARPQIQDTNEDLVRYQPNVKSNTEETEPQVNDNPVEVEAAPQPPPRRRTSRRRQNIVRQRAQEVTEAPKYFGPSAFEKIGLGQAPSGIYIPEDSLLNTLKSNTQTSTQARRASVPSPTPIVNTVQNSHQQLIIPRSNYQSVFASFFQQPSVDYYEPRQQTHATQIIPRNFHESPRNVAEFDQQTPSPFYQPSSQDLWQEDYRRQRRVQQQQPELSDRSPQSSSNDEVTHRVQRPQVAVQLIPRQPQRQRVSVEVQTSRPRRVQVTGRPVYTIDESDSFEDSRRQSSDQVVEEPRRRKKQRAEVPVTSAPVKRNRATFKPAKLAIAALPEDTDEDGIPGEAGVDYPTLHSIPSTSFTCRDQPHNGYYADLETSCQVMHLCQAGGKQNSFLCPNGTIFSQEKFSCQWWYKVNCQNSPRFYSINDQLYKIPEDKKKN